MFFPQHIYICLLRYTNSAALTFFKGGGMPVGGAASSFHSLMMSVGMREAKANKQQNKQQSCLTVTFWLIGFSKNKNKNLWIEV